MTDEKRRGSNDNNTRNIIPERTSPTERMFLSQQSPFPARTISLSPSEKNMKSCISSRSISLPPLETTKNGNTSDRKYPLNHHHRPKSEKMVLPPIANTTFLDSQQKGWEKKSRCKNRCAFDDCRAKVSSLLATGKCPKCSLHFCGSHRLYELHNCPFYSEVKNECKQDNEKALFKNRTQREVITKI